MDWVWVGWWVCSCCGVWLWRPGLLLARWPGVGFGVGWRAVGCGVCGCCRWVDGRGRGGVRGQGALVPAAVAVDALASPGASGAGEAGPRSLAAPHPTPRGQQHHRPGAHPSGAPHPACRRPPAPQPPTHPPQPEATTPAGVGPTPRRSAGHPGRTRRRHVSRSPLARPLGFSISRLGVRRLKPQLLQPKPVRN